MNRSDEQTLGQGGQVETPVEPVGKGAQVAGSIFGEPKRMVGAAEAGLQIAEYRVDPLEFRQILGLAAPDNSRLVGTPGGGHRSEAGEAFRAWKVKRATGVSFTRGGLASSVSDTAATNGTLFSEPRPTLPPLRSPPR